jgi:hypothetical protein
MGDRQKNGMPMLRSLAKRLRVLSRLVHFRRARRFRVLSMAVAVFVLVAASVEPQYDLSAQSPPNILFAISDDQSYPHAGAYGCEWVQTPNFDRVAREGLLFLNGYTPNAKCAPSRSCIVTGRNSWQLQAAGNHVCQFPQRYRSFCEVLEQATNYFVGFTGKGVDPVRAPGRQLTGKPWQTATANPPTPAISGYALHS